MFNQSKIYFLIIFLTAVFFIFNVGNSFAEISKEYDDFKDKTVYISEFAALDTWEGLIMCFCKVDNKVVERSLCFILIEDDWHFFADVDLEMKIDGKITEVEFAHEGSRIISSDRLGTDAGFLLTDNDIKRIKNADDITMRIYMRKALNITWEVPDKVLNEWKKLIERSGVLK